MSGVKFGPEGAWLQTNLVKGEGGPILPQGVNLWVKVESARTYILAVLRDQGKQGIGDKKGKIIQIDQSHNADEDNDHTTLRLETGHYEPGSYMLTCVADAGTGYEQAADNMHFNIA